MINNAQARSEESLMQAFRYRDEKSDKFWRSEYAGADLAVNYGRTGSAGKYQVKEFDNPGLCEKEAKKLIESKQKKGYTAYAEFNANNHLYFDDDETGLHPLTSHPRFRAHFKDEFYYDCVNEETPFGSDEGSDTLAHIEEDMRKNKALDFAAFPKKIIETYWDMDYIPATDLSKEAIEKLVKADEMNLIQSDMVTYATAFAQIKIMGKLDQGLKAAALNAMNRLKTIAQILKWGATDDPSEILLQMIRDLEGFPGV